MHLVMWLCMKWHGDGAWFYGVHRTCWGSSSFMWHQPCQHCKYTTSVDIKNKKNLWKLVTHVRITCKHCESAQEWRITLYKKSDQQQLTTVYNHQSCWNNSVESLWLVWLWRLCECSTRIQRKHHVNYDYEGCEYSTRIQRKYHLNCDDCGQWRFVK